MLKKNVVLIADRISTHKNADIYSKDLEVVDDIYFKSMYNAIKKIAPSVKHYDSPNKFINNIRLHTNDVVLSVWSGLDSRNRRALVPAICESKNIAYVGADAYLQAICQDKDTSKVYARKYGISSPRGTLIYCMEDLTKLQDYHFPIVIKPNFEGGSIGIFNRNLIDYYDDALYFGKELLQSYCPLIAEEYIEGEEISYCIVGIQGKIDLFEAIRQYIDGKTYIKHALMGAENKKLNNYEQLWDCVTTHIPDDYKKYLINFYNHLGKTELIRIDGRLNESGFYLLELSTDVGLSPASTMTQAFEAAGYDYHEMFEILLSNAITNWEYQNANML